MLSASKLEYNGSNVVDTLYCKQCPEMFHSALVD